VTGAQSWKQVHSPLIMVGFNRKHRAMMVTSTVCEVHRLTIPSCARLAERYPRDLQVVLDRMLRFDKLREAKLNSSWWCATKSLRHQAWFRDSDEAFLQELVKNLHTELFLPNEVLVLEGDVADSTMLLECGTVAIERVDTRSLYSNDRIGEVHDGYWIGEMAMFAGESKRRATITAITVCKVRRLYNKELVRLLCQFPTERQRFRQLAEHRLRAAEKEQLEDHTFFKDFDRAFLNLLRQKCKAQVYFAGEVLMNQGDPADTLFILGQDSFVTLNVDGQQVKKLVGRACLGTKALLSARPVKRASTVITQTVCAVRTLTREDWLDALKLHPEHQKWLSSFTKDQMGKVSEARAAFTKKRAWEMIHQRELTATALHCERLIEPEIYVRQTRQRHRSVGSSRSGSRKSHFGGKDSGQFTARTSSIEDDLSAMIGGCDASDEFSFYAAPKPSQAVPEIWECFNGSLVTVPHTRLPHLASNEDQNQSDELDSKERRSTRKSALARSESDESFDYDEVEEALGMAAQKR
jgi:CRP-like cAMP-binding protein